jgi:hypothetical protein
VENGNHPGRTRRDRQKSEKLTIYRKIRKPRNVIPKPGLGLNMWASPKFPGKISGKTDTMYIARAKVFRKLAGIEWASLNLFI